MSFLWCGNDDCGDDGDNDGAIVFLTCLCKFFWLIKSMDLESEYNFHCRVGRLCRYIEQGVSWDQFMVLRNGDTTRTPSKKRLHCYLVLVEYCADGRVCPVGVGSEKAGCWCVVIVLISTNTPTDASAYFALTHNPQRLFLTYHYRHTTQPHQYLDSPTPPPIRRSHRVLMYLNTVAQREPYRVYMKPDETGNALMVDCRGVLFDTRFHSSNCAGKGSVCALSCCLSSLCALMCKKSGAWAQLIVCVLYICMQSTMKIHLHGNILCVREMTLSEMNNVMLRLPQCGH